MLEACTAAVLVAAVLVGVMRLDSWAALSIVPGTWSVSCAGWQSFGLIAGFLSFVFLGGARRLELSP